jgi:hypothetical protein
MWSHDKSKEINNNNNKDIKSLKIVVVLAMHLVKV